MSLRAELENLVQVWARTHYPQVGTGPWVRPCADPRHGHFQTHLPMVAGKQTGTNPRDIATRLANECTPPQNWAVPEVAGTFKLTSPWWLANKLEQTHVISQLV